jgi:glycerophosphoryl diester phosphodiesterase
MVEIKQQSLDKWGAEEVMRLLIQQLQPHSKQCILISFNHEAILLTKQLSTLETGWVLKKNNHKTLQRALQLKPNYLIIDKLEISPNKAVPTGPWIWMLYGINTLAEAQQAAEQGYYLMETDNICALMQDQQAEACNGL